MAVDDWIKDGYSVVLHAGEIYGMMCLPDEKNGRLICVDVGPDKEFLGELQWPDFLAAAGCKFCPYDQSTIEASEFSEVINF